MSQSSLLIRVLLVGAHGNLGTPLASSLLSPRFQGKLALSALIRPLAADASAELKTVHASLQQRGTQLVYGSVSQSEAELTPLLRGFDVVISGVRALSLGEDQLRLLRAAKAAGVRWFIPSQFTFDAAAVGKGSPIPFFDPKIDVEAAVKASGLDWTIVNTGAFSEFLLSPFMGVDAATRTLTIPVSGSVRVTGTSVADIGTILGDAIVSGRGRNQRIFTGHTTLTYDELHQQLERVTGKPWKKVVQTREELQAKVGDQVYDQASFGLLLANNVATSWPLSQTYNVQHGIPTANFEDMLRKAVTQ